MSKTYDIYTVTVKNTCGKWVDHSNCGADREGAYSEGWEIANKGVATGIRIDTYKPAKKLAPPVYTRIDVLNPGN